MGEVRTLSDEEIFSRIDVTPPYFALSDIGVDDRGDLVAAAPIEQPFGNEIGPISGAEAGRHLAIAGSLAAALRQPSDGRHHYLATDAEIRRARKPPARVDALVLRASGRLLDRRTAHAVITAESDAGKPVYSMSCYYTIVAYDTMRSVFAEHRRETPAPSGNPYIDLLEPEQIDIAGGHIEVDLGVVEPEHCAGHFDGLPAMPVAYLMSNVMFATGRLLRRELSDDTLRISVREGSVRADDLAFAGEQVRLRGEYQGSRYNNEWVYIEAFATNEKRVGAVHLKIAPAT